MNLTLMHYCSVWARLIPIIVGFELVKNLASISIAISGLLSGINLIGLSRLATWFFSGSLLPSCFTCL